MMVMIYVIEYTKGKWVYNQYLVVSAEEEFHKKENEYIYKKKVKKYIRVLPDCV